MTRERKCVNGNVVIDEIQEEKKTASGIYLIEKETRGKLRKGRVILADEDVLVKKDEIAYYRPGSGYSIQLDNKDYLIMRANELQLVEMN